MNNEIIITYQLDENSCFDYINKLPVKPFNSVEVSNEEILKEPHNDNDILKWESELDPNDINFGEFNTGKWVWAKDYRNISLYDTANGNVFTSSINIIGSLPEGVTDIPRPDETYVWYKNAWTQDKQKALAFKRVNKLAEINNNAQKFINFLTEDTPDFEKSTWSIQAEEAKAWMGNNILPTPMLDNISISRGIDREVLIKKAYKKAITYEQIIAHITGLRQKYEDLLKEAITSEAIDSIYPEYSLPKKI